jgi:MoaA/NifB/PqqE/SkfB family radical SAM enzyme
VRETDELEQAEPPKRAGDRIRRVLRCRHAYEALTVHANGDVVCSIIDGRGDFVLGNVNRESLTGIWHGPRLAELRRLMLSRANSYCPAIGKRCPLKNITITPDDRAEPRLRFLMIEPTTACDLRCLTCPVRDFSGDVTWRDAFVDGGVAFAAWDGLRRGKQYAADAVRRMLPVLDRPPSELGPASLLMRGRVRKGRTGTLPIEVLKRVILEAGDGVERVDLFNYGEPFLYRQLTEALRCVRATMPRAAITISTDGMQVQPAVERVIVDERLLDWVVFSVDGCDGHSYSKYRIRGQFNVAFKNMLRFRERAKNTPIRVIWQYVVFRWNDRNDQFQRAIDLAERVGIPIWFDFAHTWGRSRRRANDVRYLTPYLRPFTALPGESRRDGW